MPGTGRRPRENAHQQIAADGPTAALPGTRMTVLFPGRVKWRPLGTEMTGFVPGEDGQEEDGSKKGDSDPDDGEKLAVAGEKAEVRGGGD